MDGFSKRLKRGWQAQVERSGVKPRKGIGRFRSVWLRFVHLGYFRVFAWAAAIFSESAHWQICALLATAQAMFHTSLLLGRGDEEFRLSIYGASDTEILEPARKALRKRVATAIMDASIILGIWWLQSKVPGWAFLLGVPSFAVAAAIGPAILATVLPARVVPFLTIASFLSFPAIAILSSKMELPGAWGEGVFLIAGSLSPPGWVVVMIRGLLEGRLILLGGLLVLAAGAYLARAFSRSLDEKLLIRVTAGAADDQPEFSRDAKSGFPERDDTGDRTSYGARVGRCLEEAVQGARRLELEDVPSGSVAKPRIARKALWTVGIVLGIALIGRPEVLGLDSSRYFLLGVSLALAYHAWLPLFSVPAWFQDVSLSANRVCAMFSVFPISLRRLLLGQIRQDALQALKVLPPLTVLAFVAFQVGWFADWRVALACAAVISLEAFLLLPLRWLRLAIAAHSKHPMGLSFVMRAALFVIITVLFTSQAIMTIVLFGVGFSEMSDDFGSLVSGLAMVAVLGFGNAFAGLIGTRLEVRAYEKGKFDLVRDAPKDGL